MRGAATDRDDHRSLRLLYLTPEKVRSYSTAHTCASGSTAKPLVGCGCAARVSRGCGKVSNSGSFFSLLKGLEKAGMLDR